MNSYRLFIDLPLDALLSQSLSRQFAALALPWAKIKKTKASDWHLTLKFLGEKPLADLPEIIKVLTDINLNLGDIELSITSPQIFQPNNPRVLVLALAPNDKLSRLQAKIENSLYQAGLSAKENRRFSPHLTLARVKQAVTLSELKPFLDWRPASGSSLASYFELQQSELGPQGPRYSVLQTFDL